MGRGERSLGISLEEFQHLTAECFGLNCVFQNSYVEALIPGTLKYDYL